MDEAKRHLSYLKSMFEIYHEVGKEKIAIRKMAPPLNAALLELGMPGLKFYPKDVEENCQMGCACSLHEEGMRKAHEELLKQAEEEPTK